MSSSPLGKDDGRVLTIRRSDEKHHEDVGWFDAHWHFSEPVGVWAR